MATKLQVINNIMRRLREPTVTSSTDNAYSKLISAFVAESYEEVLDEWNWRPVAESCIMAVPAGSATFDVTATVAGPVPDGRLVAIRDGNEPVGHSIDKDHATPVDEVENEPAVSMTELAIPDFANMSIENPDPDTTGLSSYFAIRPLPDESLRLLFYPPSARDFFFQMIFYRRPQRLELADSVTDDGYEFEIPYRPIQELAMMYALNERGEEMGEPGNLAQGRYIQALSSAKEIDLKAGEHSNSFDWGRD